jgi:hypothetical protein
MTADPVEYHITSPPPRFYTTTPEAGKVPIIEKDVQYQSMTVTDTSEFQAYTNVDGPTVLISESGTEIVVTVTKRPQTTPENKSGDPPIFCSRLRINGTWDEHNETYPAATGWTETSSVSSGGWTDEISTPFAAASGAGTTTNTDPAADPPEETYDTSRDYGPGWNGAGWGGELGETTMVGGELLHTASIVDDDEFNPSSRDLIVQFNDPHTEATAAAAIAEAIAEEDDWEDDELDPPYAELLVVFVDAPADLRLTGASGRICRYRDSPPASWFTAWDAWKAGGEIGTEPLVRTVWESEWDEVFASHEWWAWFDGGEVGTEPTPGPSLAASRSWTWDGDPENRFSEWYNMEMPTAAGQTRRANYTVICWQSARHGVLPTSHGIIVEIPEP